MTSNRALGPLNRAEIVGREPPLRVRHPEVAADNGLANYPRRCGAFLTPPPARR